MLTSRLSDRMLQKLTLGTQESLLYLSLINDSILQLVNHGDTFCCTNLHFYCISFPGRLFNSSKVMHLLLSLISLTQLKEVLLLMFLLSALCKGLTSIVFHLLKLLRIFSRTEQVKLPKLFWLMNHQIYDVYFVLMNSAINLFC